MKAALCLVASGAILALANPLENRAVHTEVVTNLVFVTVTEGFEPTAAVTEDKVEPTPTPDPVPVPVKTSDPPPPPPAQETRQPAPQPKPAEPAPQPQSPTGGVKQPQTNIKAPNDFASTSVYHHNIHRENCSVAALEWADTYAGYAAETAKTCKFAHDMGPGGGGYGQNLAMWGSSDNPEALGAEKAMARAITNMWYNGEIMLYPNENYGKPNPTAGVFEQYGHYTQVVWAGTKKVGCAAQYCPPGTMFDKLGAWFSVCNYYPPGNMGGEYGKNVLKPSANKQTITAA